MRILSRRLDTLRQPSPAPILHQARYLSSTRYSNPAKRTFTAAPAATPTSSFLGNKTSEQPSEIEAVPASLLSPNSRGTPEAKRQYHVRRMRFAAMGLLLTLVGLGFTISRLELDDMGQVKKAQGVGKQQLDASSEANMTFQGKEVHVVGAGEDKRIVAEGQGQQIELVETGTSSVPHFPRTILLPVLAGTASQSTEQQPGAAPLASAIDNQEEYTLVGLGIRTVMWIQVYVVGFYVRTSDISYLQEKLIHQVNPIASTLVPSEKESLKAKLLDGTASTEIWAQLLAVPGIQTAWRVSPTRNTDFSHLRDGFVTGISKRTQEARKGLAGGQETEFDAEDFGQAIQSFKGIFAGGKAPKGSILLMVRDRGGALEVLFQAKPDGSGNEKAVERLGGVADERISKLIWMNYLSGDKVSSEPARKGVVDGLVVFAGRPIGSVEARVT